MQAQSIDARSSDLDLETPAPENDALDNAGDAISEPRVNKALALVEIDGVITAIEAETLTALKKALRPYPPSALKAVWRGRQMPLKTEVKVTF